MAVRPSNGYPSLARLPNDPSSKGMLRMVSCQLNGAINTDPIPCYALPHAMCPNLGGPKKGPKLSRLGELLNTQKNVHFLHPRAPGAPQGSRGVPKVHPQKPPIWAYNVNKEAPDRAPEWAPNWGPGGAPRGPRGAPGGRPGPGEIFRKIFPGAPRPGGPVWGCRIGNAMSHQWCYNH